MIACTIARCHGNRREVADFLLTFEPREPERQTPEQMLAILTRMAQVPQPRPAMLQPRRR